MLKLIISIKKIRNPYILFLPLIILYILIILILSKNYFEGDERRYIMYAQNLAKGFYSSPPPYLDLGNGPGYPIILTPLLLLGLPLFFIKLLNAILYYFSVVFLFKTVRQLVTFKFALIISLIWALYPYTFENIYNILPEVLVSFLVVLLVHAFFKVFKPNQNDYNLKFIIISGLIFGFLALTKPIFGYVLMFMLAGILILLVINRTSLNYKKSLLVLIISLLTTLPWLAYTYHMTGKLFYWSTYGGNNLYWMSTPYENEYGNYIAFPFNATNLKTQFFHNHLEEIKKNHEKDFEEILQSKEARDLYFKNGEIVGSPYTGVIQDDILKKIALRNILSHPLKFIQNCISNAGRLMFNYPYSYKLQNPGTLIRFPIGGIILTFILFTLFPAIINWKRIYFPVRFIFLIAVIYLGGSLLGSADIRMFTVVVPIFFVWITYILSKTIKIKFHWD